jgi:hypothetical protein
MNRRLTLPRAARAGLGLLALAALLAGGCTPRKNFTLKGSVSYQGKPVPAGIVKFYGPGDRLSVAYVQPDGTFEITDLVPGPVKVAVEEDPGARMKASMGTPPAGGAVQHVSIPPRYWDEKTSGLEFTIDARTKDLPIKLE